MGKHLDWVYWALSQETDKCLIWPYFSSFQGGKSGGPWGMLWDERGIKRTVGNLVCRKAHGDPEKGQQASHSCGNGLCGNKRHLSWKSRSGNWKDRLDHGWRLPGRDNKGRFIA